MFKLNKTLLPIVLFNIIFSATVNAALIQITGNVTPDDANPFTVAVGPTGSGECNLSWHTSSTPNVQIQRLWIYGPQGGGVNLTSRDLSFQIPDGGPGPDADETLTINDLLIGEIYSFNLFSIVDPLTSPGVWTVPATCEPTPAQDPPVQQDEPTNTVGVKNTLSFNHGLLPDTPGLRCQVTASLVDLNSDPGGDPVNDIYSGWMDCAAAPPGGLSDFNFSYEFTGLALNQTYFYHVQSTSDGADPPAGGFSAYSNVTSSRQVSGGGGGGGGPYCGDGVVNTTGEECDDGNTGNGDGCNTSCKLEVVLAPAAPECGNGVIEAPEQCDDGNLLNLDGCSSVCELEEIVTVKFFIKAKPQYRVLIGSNPNLSLNAQLIFNKPSIGSSNSGYVSLSDLGLGTYEGDLVTGTYNIGINGEAHLNIFLNGIEITPTTKEVTLDFTQGNTIELIAGDSVDNNTNNAQDIAKIIGNYKLTSGTRTPTYASVKDYYGGAASLLAATNIPYAMETFQSPSVIRSVDFNNSAKVDAIDIAIDIWNYKMRGES